MRANTTKILPAIMVVAAIAVTVVLLLRDGDGSPGAANAVDADAERQPADEGKDRDQRAAASAYDRALRKLDSQIEGARERAEASRDSWMDWERLASLHVSRAKLTGDFEDYLAAERALDRGFEVAPEGGGPEMTRARLHFRLHRLEQASEALDGAGTQMDVDYREARIAGLRGDILLHRGEYDEAHDKYLASDEAHPTTTSAFRLAQWHAKTGDFETADEWMRRALERTRGSQPRTEAFLRLNRGILDLDQARYDEALDHYREASEAFDGWWLVEEHIAEIHAIQGRTEEAIAIYRDVVERTESPELMDALADALETRGDDGDGGEAKELRARARRAYEKQLDELPEAAYGHALEHFLGAGEAERALDLARKNFQLRPGGEARVLLARALAENGQHEEAAKVIEVALDSAYESAELHTVAADIYEALGQTQRAEDERRAANAIAP